MCELVCVDCIVCASAGAPCSSPLSLLRLAIAVCWAPAVRAILLMYTSVLLHGLSSLGLLTCVRAAAQLSQQLGSTMKRKTKALLLVISVLSLTCIFVFQTPSALTDRMSPLDLTAALADSAPEQRLCRHWKEAYNVQPLVSWGTLPESLQSNWTLAKCDLLLSPARAPEVPTPPPRRRCYRQCAQPCANSIVSGSAHPCL